MQEQNSEKVVSLSVRATKVTANVLKSAVRAYLSAQKNKSPKVYKGKQSVKHLIQKGEKLTNIEVTDQNIKSFNKTARKYGIDYSLKKDGSEKPPRYPFRKGYSEARKHDYRQYKRRRQSKR